MNKLRTNINLKDDETRAIYFHDMAEDSRELELLLNTCYNYGIIPIYASKGREKEKPAYIILKTEKKYLENIGMLIDLVKEIPNSEFNIKNNNEIIYTELSCDSIDGKQLFTRIKDIIEESIIENNRTYNYTIMNTVYNIANIINEVTESNIIFATDKTLFTQGKFLLSIYKEKQQNKINTKKADDVLEVIDRLKNKATLNIPTVFFCSFDELRNFYFELDEIVYSIDIEGENNE